MTSPQSAGSLLRRLAIGLIGTVVMLILYFGTGALRGSTGEVVLTVLVCSVFALPVGLLLLQWLIPSLRYPEGTCRRCGYDLTGIDGVCPECGREPC